MNARTRHVTQRIALPAAEVVAYVRHYPNLPLWAAGLASGITEVDGRWFTDSPMGRVEVRFVAENDLGVCDHDVTLPDGTVTRNPVRVIADGDACDVVFTLRPTPGVTLEAFDGDLALITADLVALRRRLETPQTP